MKVPTFMRQKSDGDQRELVEVPLQVLYLACLGVDVRRAPHPSCVVPEALSSPARNFLFETTVMVNFFSRSRASVSAPGSSPPKLTREPNANTA